MGSAAATAMRMGLGDVRRDLDLCNKKQNTQSKRWCQTIKRRDNKPEGSQQKRQTRAYMIFRYLQSSKTGMLNISKTVACQKIRPPPHHHSRW